MTKLTRIACLLFVVSVCLISVYAAWRLNGSPRTAVDDAEIYMSYAENLAGGEGFAYANNLERVEGFTSILWLLLCASQFMIGTKEIGVVALSVCIFVCSQFLSLHIIKRHCTEKGLFPWKYQVPYMVFILMSPAHVAWVSITLMDIGLWGLMALALAYILIFPPQTKRQNFIAATAFAIAPLVRPEAMLVAPVMLVLMCIHAYQRIRNFRKALGTGIICATAFTTSMAGLTVFRLLYFGYPLPNTFYAKVSPSLLYNILTGIKYFKRFLFSDVVIPYCIAVVFIVVLHQATVLVNESRITHSAKNWINKPLSKLFWLSVVSIVLIAIPILEGGDHFALHRFYQPLYPVLGLVLVFWLIELSSGSTNKSIPTIKKHKIVAVVLGLASLACVVWGMHHGTSSQFYWFHKTSPLQVEYEIAQKGRNNGEALKTLFEYASSYPSIGVLTAGGIARTYPGPIVDVMGLNSVEIAHAKGDRRGLKNHAAFNKDVFLKILPDALIEAPPLYPEKDSFSARAFRGLYFDTKFIAEYTYGRLTSTTDPENSFSTFYSKKFIEKVTGGDMFTFLETIKYEDDGFWHNLDLIFNESQR